MFDVVEATIADLRAALESGRVTSAELVRAYLARIDAYDGPETATALNAVVVRNPDARAEAEASDARRAAGATLGPLDGIPYTAKDSYLVAGLTAGGCFCLLPLSVTIPSAYKEVPCPRPELWSPPSASAPDCRRERRRTAWPLLVRLSRAFARKSRDQ